MRRAGLLLDRRGVTLIEVMVTVGILSLVTAGLVSMLMQSLRGWSSGTSGGTSTAKGTFAIQRLASDIRDAKSAVVSSGRLVVTFPSLVEDPSTGEQIYDLSSDDPVTRSYYVSDGNLVRTAGGTTVILCRGVTSASFHAWGGTVTVTTLTGSDCDGTHTATQEMTGSIALRNFKS